MPHSIKPEPEVPITGEVDMEEVPISNGESQDDVDMTDAVPEPAAATAGNNTTQETKSEVKLDDLFAHVESDDEFPTSSRAAAEKTPASSSPEGMTPTSSDDDDDDDDPTDHLKASDPEVMKSFYQRLFPWRQLFQWLNHSPTPSNDFNHREFAFTLSNDAYLRYQTFPTGDLLKKDVLRLMPSRFEIGPVYNTQPRDRKTVQIKPISKELCFDIDLTDYDDIRTCCDKANICNKCWQFMTMAIKVIDAALREDFGFKHIMWVYSGRRGAHAWVCDAKARVMGDQKRRAIAGYLEVIRGGAQSGKKVNLKRPLHPHLVRSLDLLKTHFQEDVLEVQNPWESSEQAEKLLNLLPDRQLNESLRKKWDSAPGRASRSKWADIDALAKTGASTSLDAKALLEAKKDIILEYTYPRLDIEVSKKLNHLLKSPFVVHPGTGRVCVPIDTENLEDFDPLGVPTVQSLLQEIDAWKEPEKMERKIEDWEKTSLKPYVEQFRSFVMDLMKDEPGVRVKRERDEGAESIEF